MASRCSFLEKLSPEIRVQIYGHVFEPGNVIKPSNSAASLGIAKNSAFFVDNYIPPEVSLNTSILSTNKTIYNEAIKVLYDDKIIRGTFADFNKLLQNTDFSLNIRRVEIADCVGVRRPSVYGMIQTLEMLPQVRSVVILSDCLGCIGLNSRSFNHTSAHEFFTGFGKLIPVEVGRYQLPDEFRNVQIANRKLIKMWSSVKNAPPDYDPVSEYAGLLDKHRLGGDSVAWVLETSFRCWVGLHNQLLVQASSGRLPELSAQLAQGLAPRGGNDLMLLVSYANTTRPHKYSAIETIVQALSAPPPDGFGLQWISPRKWEEGDSADSLAWATEYLSLNIAGFRSAFDEHVVRPSHWAEADGGLQTVAWKEEWQQRTLAGVINKHYIQDPVRDKKLISYQEALLWAYMSLEPQLEYFKSKEKLSPLEVKQLAYLHLAKESARSEHLRGLRYDQPSLDAWALGLLRRYLFASGLLDWEIIQQASLSDLRGCIEISVAALGAVGPEAVADRIPMIDRAPPQGLSEDLFLPLAWTNGRLLEYCFKRIDEHGGIDGIVGRGSQERANGGNSDEENSGEENSDWEDIDEENSDEDDGVEHAEQDDGECEGLSDEDRGEDVSKGARGEEGTTADATDDA